MNILEALNKELVCVHCDNGVTPVYRMHLKHRDGDKPPFRVSPSTGGIGLGDESMKMTAEQMRACAAMLNHAADMMESQ